MRRKLLRIAMLSLHSSPVGDLGAPDTGGLSVYVREVAAQLSARGHQVDLFTGRSGPAAQGVLRLAPGVRLVSLPSGLNGTGDKLALYPRLPAFAQALEEFRREEGLTYDVIHSHYWLSGCVGAWAQRVWRVPHVVMFHTLGVLKNRAGCGEDEPPLRLAEEEALARTCDRVVAPTLREREMLIRDCGAPAERVAVIPGGVNQQLFRPQDRSCSRDGLGLSQGNAVLLFVGRFVPVKGLDLLLAALARFPAESQVRLLVVGGDSPTGQGAQQLREQAAGLGVGERVHFLGRLPQESLPQYYSAADLVVFPSHYESFGLVPLEAMSCGTPVIATRVGAMEEVIRRGVNGFLADQPTPEALTRALEAGLQGSRAATWEPHAIRASVADYSWARVADALLAEYEGLIGVTPASRACVGEVSEGRS